jgi:hypothetical protein
MKIKLLLFTFALATTGLLLMSNSGGRATTGGGDNSGAPSANTCAQCHSGGAFNPSISVEVFEENTSTAVTEYVPGIVYDIKITVNADAGASGFGLQATVLDANNAPIVGFSSPGANAQLATLNGRQFLEQVNTSSSNEFTSQWTAPAAGTGSAIFYAAGNAVNGNGTTGGDGASNTSFTLAEDLSSSNLNVNQLKVAMKAFPNPVQDILNIETIGSTDGEHSLTITNMVGQVVHQSVVNLDLGMDLTQVDVQQLPKGMYSVSLAQANKIATITIIKQKT